MPDPNGKAIAAHGGVKTLLTALRTHVASVSVAENVCCILTTLAHGEISIGYVVFDTVNTKHIHTLTHTQIHTLHTCKYTHKYMHCVKSQYVWNSCSLTCKHTYIRMHTYILTYIHTNTLAYIHTH